MRNMDIPSLTSMLWCYEVYNLCDVPEVRPYELTFPKTEPSNRTRPAVSGKEPLKVVHISDIHVDLSYTVGANSNCTEDICCYIYTTEDAPNATDSPAGPWGNHNCDSPLNLEESLYAAIQSVAADAEFTLFTGDLVEGREWMTTHTEIVNDINSAYTHISGLNLVYGAVGNHEASPVNSFPQAGIDVPTDQTNQYMYETLATNWAQWLGNSTASTVRTHHGAYSIDHSASLRVISINTMFYEAENWWLYNTTMAYDPSSQFEWLINELQAAENASQRAYVIGHIPFGRPDALYDYSAYFDQIVKRYEATVSAYFFGHTHRDQWEVSYSDYAKPSAATAMATHYIAPALTPTSGNPTFRVYSVDPDTWAVIDYTVYFANMSAPGYQNRGPMWEEYYSVRSAYGALLSPSYDSESNGTKAPAAELTPAFWHNVSVLFENDDEAFQAYYARRTRGWEVEECTGSCKADEICEMRSSQSQYACYTSGAVSVKKKRDVKAGVGAGGGGARSVLHGDRGECSGSRAGPVVRHFARNLRLLK